MLVELYSRNVGMLCTPLWFKENQSQTQKGQRRSNTQRVSTMIGLTSSKMGYEVHQRHSLWKWTWVWVWCLNLARNIFFSWLCLATRIINHFQLVTLSGGATAVGCMLIEQSYNTRCPFCSNPTWDWDLVSSRPITFCIWFWFGESRIDIDRRKTIDINGDYMNTKPSIWVYMCIVSIF